MVVEPSVAILHSWQVVGYVQSALGVVVDAGGEHMDVDVDYVGIVVAVVED